MGVNLCTIQKILDKTLPEDYKCRQNKKVTCLNFRNENAKYEFLNALNGNGTFDDRICILYQYFYGEKSTSSYRFIINKSKKIIIKNSYSQNCLIN
jgi:CO dehydrogenase/acetyl-CoA synthase epsilon subunit